MNRSLYKICERLGRGRRLPMYARRVPLELDDMVDFAGYLVSPRYGVAGRGMREAIDDDEWRPPLCAERMIKIKMNGGAAHATIRHKI